jgi:hypothetical protein
MTLALVPLAMSSFVTVVTGISTIHVPLAAGVVAATLQHGLASLLSVGSEADEKLTPNLETEDVPHTEFSTEQKRDTHECGILKRLLQIVTVVAVCIASGAIALPLSGLIFALFVPLAMSLFGTVIPGVGSVHATLNACGLAAILQALSAFCLTITGVYVGAGIGFGVAMLLTASDLLELLQYILQVSGESVKSAFTAASESLKGTFTTAGESAKSAVESVKVAFQG